MKNNKIQKGQKKFNQLTKEIDDMWYCLENEHKVSEIIKIEDEIKNKGRQLRKLKAENKTA